MIEIRDLRHRIIEIPALSLTGGTTAVIGPNGAGKSTLLRLCAGEEVPATGSILIDGKLPRDEEIGWVDENPERTLLFERVEDELASSLRFRNQPCTETAVCVRDLIARLGISHLLPGRTWNLSAGEKVLVALGAALASRPAVLILDEVDSHLDPPTDHRVQKILSESGIRHVLVSTQQMEAAARADQVVYLEGGKILREGTPREVFSYLEDTCFYPSSWRDC